MFVSFQARTDQHAKCNGPVFLAQWLAKDTHRIAPSIKKQLWYVDAFVK